MAETVDQDHAQQMAAQFGALPAAQEEKCKNLVKTVCRRAPFVIFMLEALKKAGCEFDPETRFKCEKCPLLGAYDAGAKEVVICGNNAISESRITTVITHELIHAFDDCRAKVDFKDIRHLACTEIRAASLSGDCFFTEEFFNRFHFGLSKQHQVCVKRRAALSLTNVLNVSKETADAAVESVYDTCFKDTEPFDRIP